MQYNHDDEVIRFLKQNNVCDNVALPFTLKEYLKAKEEEE
jgi:hypothetical protein